MTSQDLYLVIGLVLVAFSIPSLLGAMADRRSPRVAALVIVVGGGLIALALSRQSYGLTDIPEAFVRVVAHFLR